MLKNFVTYGLALAFTLAILPATGLAERAGDADRPSKNGKTEGTIDGVHVVIEYGRPKVNGRKIWGGLVPYGEVWRTGANEATTITFSAPVKIEGKNLAAGTYGLFTVPGESEWTWVFNSVPNQWGAFKYDQSKDVLRVTAKPMKHAPVEAMDFVIEGNKVIVRWADLAVPFTVSAQ